MSATKIEWAEEVWNPVRGCTRVSEGCRNCYAERQAIRMAGPGGKYEGLVRSTPEGPRWTGRVNFDEATLLAPQCRKKPTRFFVNSMSDWCHEEVPDEWRDRMLAVAALCPQHTFIFLTKRAKCMREYLLYSGRQLTVALRAGKDDPHSVAFNQVLDGLWPLPNVWLLVSVEDQATADERVPHLLATPAAVRGVSAEPLLEALDISQWLAHSARCEVSELPFCVCASASRLDWVICGGESGPGARPMHPDWARSLRDQCQAAGVPFFFKQHGEFVRCETEVLPEPPGKMIYPLDEAITLEEGHSYRVIEAHGAEFVRIGKHRAGRLLDGREWNEFPKETHG